jgi:hypothetical protein
MRDKHEPEHPENCFLVCHFPKDFRDTAILLPSKPRLGEIFIEFPDDLVVTLHQPRNPFLLWQFEDGVIKLLAWQPCESARQALSEP